MTCRNITRGFSTSRIAAGREESTSEVSGRGVAQLRPQKGHGGAPRAAATTHPDPHPSRNLRSVHGRLGLRDTGSGGGSWGVGSGPTTPGCGFGRGSWGVGPGPTTPGCGFGRGSAGCGFGQGGSASVQESVRRATGAGPVERREPAQALSHDPGTLQLERSSSACAVAATGRSGIHPNPSEPENHTTPNPSDPTQPSPTSTSTPTQSELGRLATGSPSHSTGPE